MKKTGKIDAEVAARGREESRKNLFSRYMIKFRKGPITCPVCREIVHGLGELGSHMKIHCT